MALKIERKIWQPNFPNEIWITDKRESEEFQITLKQGSENIEINFDWNHGWDGRGSETTEIPIKLIKELLIELETNKIMENE